MVNKFFITLFFILIISSKSVSQSFGFGCLGFVGGFGGYSYLEYNANGLNNYVDNFNTTNSEYIDKKMESFDRAAGYRIGVNFFRANFTGVFVTAKGFYQQLQKENTATVFQTAVGVDYEYDLKLKTWGFGVDVGIPITKFLSWKIIEGSVMINNVRFTETSNSSVGTFVKKYDNKDISVGYSIGTGIIIDIIKNYISIEGLANYTILSINKMASDDGSGELNFSYQSADSDKFINEGGFNAVIQLNLGFPL